jgi:hypothetical protein
MQRKKKCTYKLIYWRLFLTAVVMETQNNTFPDMCRSYSKQMFKALSWKQGKAIHVAANKTEHTTSRKVSDFCQILTKIWVFATDFQVTYKSNRVSKLQHT